MKRYIVPLLILGPGCHAEDTEPKGMIHINPTYDMAEGMEHCTEGQAEFFLRCVSYSPGGATYKWIESCMKAYKAFYCRKGYLK